MQVPTTNKGKETKNDHLSFQRRFDDAATLDYGSGWLGVSSGEAQWENFDVYVYSTGQRVGGGTDAPAKIAEIRADVFSTTPPDEKLARPTPTRPFE